MTSQKPNKGNPFGLHRVLGNEPVLVQAAEKVDASLPIWSNEILVNVEALQIDSASFNQLKNSVTSDDELSKKIMHLVKTQGKMQNPITKSGGMLLGEVVEIGKDYPDDSIQVGDRIATLISLTATPLHLNKIKRIEQAKERATVSGHAILFERTLFAKMPKDISEGVALAAFDVCGAPQISLNHTKVKDTVFVLGLGKAGRSIVALLNLEWGDQIQILGIDPSQEAVNFCKKHFSGHFEVMDAQKVLKIYDWVQSKTQNQGADFVVNTTNVPHTEMSTILGAKSQGKCLFFGMATSFQRASLGAESVAQDLTLLMGTGYAKGHAETMINLLRKCPPLLEFFENNFS